MCLNKANIRLVGKGTQINEAGQRNLNKTINILARRDSERNKSDETEVNAGFEEHKKRKVITPEKEKGRLVKSW